jgi:hypothetical protein
MHRDIPLEGFEVLEMLPQEWVWLLSGIGISSDASRYGMWLDGCQTCPCLGCPRPSEQKMLGPSGRQVEEPREPESRYRDHGMHSSRISVYAVDVKMNVRFEARQHLVYRTI